ncbi:hypothetical protein QTP86_020695 [Hemibagrus guttatus]|nr:hypothetical protein QTP86_020695 [Hemibagrus guttatus]
MEHSIDDPLDLVVYMGKQTQDGSNPHEVARGVTKIVKHPSYDPFTNNNDITLLRLNQSVAFTKYIKPVCLAGKGSSFAPGTRCWVTGWGNIASGGVSTANHLSPPIPIFCILNTCTH